MNDRNAIFFQVLLEYHVAPTLHSWKSLSASLFYMIGYHLVLPSKNEKSITKIERTNIQFEYVYIQYISRKFIKYMEYSINMHTLLIAPHENTLLLHMMHISTRESSPWARPCPNWWWVDMGSHESYDDWPLPTFYVLSHITRVCDVTSGSISFLWAKDSLVRPKYNPKKRKLKKQNHEYP